MQIVSSPEIVPEVVRKAFKVAESEKPGATHLELPEDVMAGEIEPRPLPYHAPVHPEPGLKELDRAVRIITAAEKPVALAGHGAVRTRAGDADVVIAIGYDLVEHAPEHWNPNADKRIVMVDTGHPGVRPVLCPAAGRRDCGAA